MIKAIKVKLGNGFTFVVDFVENDKVNSAVQNWESYYNNLKVESLVSAIEMNSRYEILQLKYERYAYSLFGESFSKLDTNSKLSVSEYVGEVSC